MRRTLAAPGLAAVLGMALLLTACGKTNAHNNTAGETVSTALFDFSITDVSLVESYPGIDIPDGERLVRMRLNIKNDVPAGFPNPVGRGRQRLRHLPERSG